MKIKMNIDKTAGRFCIVFQIEKVYSCIFGDFSFIHFHTHFSSRESRGCSSPRRTRNTSRSTAISDNLLAPPQDGTK